MTYTQAGLDQITVCYNRALQTGTYTAEYMRQLVQNGKMEKRVIDGCMAMLRLARICGQEQMEGACKRGLEGTRYNYSTIKLIIDNGLSTAPLCHPADCPMSPCTDHENLRGVDFFDSNPQ